MCASFGLTEKGPVYRKSLGNKRAGHHAPEKSNSRTGPQPSPRGEESPQKVHMGRGPFVPKPQAACLFCASSRLRLSLKQPTHFQMIPIFPGNIVNISTGLCSFKMCDTVFKEMSCLGDPAVCLRDGMLGDQLGGGGGDSKNQSQ